ASSCSGRPTSPGSVSRARKPRADRCATRPTATPPPGPRVSATKDRMGTDETFAAQTIDLAALVRETSVHEVLAELDADLIGLQPVKQRIRQIAAFLVVSAARRRLGLEATAP